MSESETTLPTPKTFDTLLQKSAPRDALLNAANVSLDFARQYLDKFLNWFDYLIASHYTAVALSLAPASRDRAQALFDEVDASLNQGDLFPRRPIQPENEAKARMRAEAIYNKGILLMYSGDSDDLAAAHAQFDRLLEFIGGNTAEADTPRGVRLAAQFAIILIEQTTADAPTPAFARKRILFLDQLRIEISRLKPQIRDAEIEVDRLQAEMSRLQAEMNSGESPSIQKNKLGQGKIITELARVRDEVKKAQSRVTKFSKDGAILRSMETRLKNDAREGDLFVDR